MRDKTYVHGRSGKRRSLLDLHREWSSLVARGGTEAHQRAALRMLHSSPLARTVYGLGQEDKVGF